MEYLHAVKPHNWISYICCAYCVYTRNIQECALNVCHKVNARRRKFALLIISYIYICCVLYVWYELRMLIYVIRAKSLTRRANRNCDS